MLAAALDRLRLEGALFFRSELSEAFEFVSTPDLVPGALDPRVERVILFHIVPKGSCWITVQGGDRHWTSAGDVIVLKRARGPAPSQWRAARSNGRAAAHA